jgi:short-subunit dehydrogenase
VFSRIDILLYNAGLLINKDFREFTNAEIMNIFNVNFFSAARVIQELLPLMGGERTSHIVNIGSMGGFRAVRNSPVSPFTVQARQPWHA